MLFLGCQVVFRELFNVGVYLACRVCGSDGPRLLLLPPLILPPLDFDLDAFLALRFHHHTLVVQLLYDILTSQFGGALYRFV